MDYQPGDEIQIRRHEPPAPSKSYKCFFGDEAWARRQEAMLPQLSDEHPPAKGGRLGPPVDLKITGALRTGKPFHSQVVKAYVPTLSQTKRSLVAKFYDPFRAENEDDPELNFFWLADQEYAAEAAAYSRLTSLQGILFPRFFGSYTCELSTGLGNNTRSIRLILLEFIAGAVMTSFNEGEVRNIPQAARKNIMFQIVEADSRAWALGVRHGDVHPRNVILETGFPHKSASRNEEVKDQTYFADPAVRLRLFDFGTANLGPFEIGLSEVFRGHRDKAISPILRWHVELRLYESFKKAGWVDWDWSKWLKETWLNSTFYEPITREAEKAWLLPWWQPRIFPV